MCWFLYYFKQEEFRAQKIPWESRALRSWFLRSQEMRYCQSTNWFSNEILGQFLLLKNNSDNKGELFWQCLYVCLSLKHFKIYIYWIETSGKKCFSLSYCIFCSLVTKMSFLPPLASYCCFSTKTKWKEIEGKKGGNGKLLSKVISVGIFNNALAWQQKQVLRMISAELLFWAGLGTTTKKSLFSNSEGHRLEKWSMFWMPSFLEQQKLCHNIGARMRPAAPKLRAVLAVKMWV